MAMTRHSSIWGVPFSYAGFGGAELTWNGRYVGMRYMEIGTASQLESKKVKFQVDSEMGWV